MTQKKVSYFISPLDAPKFTQMVGLGTTILTGLHSEKMMMVLNTTLPGHIVSITLSSTRANWNGICWQGDTRIRDEERIVQKGDFYFIPANVSHSDTCIGDEPFVMLDIFYPVREDFIKKIK